MLSLCILFRILCKYQASTIIIIEFILFPIQFLHLGRDIDSRRPSEPISLISISKKINCIEFSTTID